MYKFLSEDEKSFTLEKSGKKFKVAKKALSPKFHEQVRNYADGGEVAPEDNSNQDTSRSPSSEMKLPPELQAAADKYNLSPEGKKAFKQIYQQESSSGKADTSGFNSSDVTGPMQVKQSTFNSLKQQGVIPPNYEITNPQHNIEASAALIKQNEQNPNIGKNVPNLKLAYFAGPKAVKPDGSINPNLKDSLGTRAVDYAKDTQPQDFAPPTAPSPLSTVPFYQRQPNAPIDVQAATQFNPNASAIAADTKYPQFNDDQLTAQRKLLVDRAMQAGYTQPNLGSAIMDVAGIQTPQLDDYSKPGEPTSNQIINNINSNPASSPNQDNVQKLNAQSFAEKEAQRQAQIIANQKNSGSSSQQAQGQPQQPTMPNGEPIPTIFDAYNDQKNANIQKASAESDLANKQADIYKDQQDQQAKLLAQQQQNVSDANKAIDDLSSQYKNNKIDPNRIYANASTGDKIVGAIGMMLSGIGSALTGQPNIALKVISDAIDRDIEAQKSEIGKGNTLLELQLKKYGNMNSALLATETIMGAQANAKILEAIDRAKDPLIKANLSQQQAMLKSALAQNYLTLQNAGAYTNATSGIGGGIPVGSQEHYRLMLNNPKLRDTQVIIKDPYSQKPDMAYQTPSPEEAKEVRKYQNSYINLNRSLNEFKQAFSDSASGKIPFSESRATLQAMRENVIKNFSELGAAGIDSKRISQPIIDMANKIIADPTKYTQFRSGAIIDQAINEMQKQYETKLQSTLYNYKPQVFTKNQAVLGGR